MSKLDNRLYEFGEFLLDPQNRSLLCQGRPVQLSPRPFDVLLLLVRRAGSVISKEDFLQEVWQGAFVEEGSLAVQISTLRKALGERRGGPKYIETVSKSGYKFVAEVRVREAAAPTSEAEAKAEEKAPEGPSVTGTTSTPPETEPGAPPEQGRRPRWVIPVLVAMVAALALGALRFYYLPRASSSPADGRQPPGLTRLTHSGRVLCLAISPDGRRVAYAAEEGGQQAVWVLDLDSGQSAQQIVAPSAARDFDGGGLTFTPDGESLYFNVFENDSLDGRLYRVPARGGTPQHLLTEIDGAVSFSPDGRQMVYLVARSNAEKLVVADADGGGGRVIVERARPSMLSNESQPAWSPDGQFIAFAAGTRAVRQHSQLMLYELASGREAPLSPETWLNVGHLAWLPGGGALVMTAQKDDGDRSSLYRVSYPQGEAVPLTTDVNSYAGAAVTRDAAAPAALASVVVAKNAQLWVAELGGGPGGEARARQVSSGEDDSQGVAWTADGRLVYGSSAGGNFDLWIMDADGGNRRQLTDDPEFDSDPDASPDNRFVVFSRRTGVYNLWRIGLDGSGLEQLTNGTGEYYPQISPDGRWVVYHRISAGDPVTVWKVPVEGGPPVQLNSAATSRAAVSPDGALVASTYRQPNEGPFRLGIYPLNGANGDTKVIEPPAGARLFVPPRWSPDGRSVVLVVRREGVDNLWSQPAAGGPARQLTNFTSEHIYGFDFAPDGGRVVLARGTQIRYAVLLTGIR